MVHNEIEKIIGTEISKIILENWSHLIANVSYILILISFLV